MNAAAQFGPTRLFLSGAMLTDVGRVRETNEDSVAYLLPREEDPRAARGALAIVADGLGGHAAGEVASRLAVEIVLRTYYASDIAPPAALAAAFAAADAAIRRRAADDVACAGMGSTCTAIAVAGDRAFLAHIGDSRAYLLRGSEFLQLSEDHSLVQALVRDGHITPEEARVHPQRNVILRAFGAGDPTEPDIWQDGLPLRAGDVLVLCSDGLFGLVPDEQIAEVIGRLPPLAACRALIEDALAAGGDDNASIGAFTVSDTAPEPHGSEEATRPIRLRSPAWDEP